MATARLLLVALVLCAGGVRPTRASPTSCYVDNSVTPSPVTLTSLGAPIAAGSAVSCVRYCLACSAGDPLCTSAQISSGSSRVAYAYVPTSTATAMASATSVYPNFYACTTTDCNTVVSGCSSSPNSPASGAPASKALRFTVLLLSLLLALALP